MISILHHHYHHLFYSTARHFWCESILLVRESLLMMRDLSGDLLLSGWLDSSLMDKWSMIPPSSENNTIWSIPMRELILWVVMMMIFWGLFDIVSLRYFNSRTSCSSDNTIVGRHSKTMSLSRWHKALLMCNLLHCTSLNIVDNSPSSTEAGPLGSEAITSSAPVISCICMAARKLSPAVPGRQPATAPVEDT